MNQPTQGSIIVFPSDPQRPADETRNRVPKCWKCSVDKKKCVIEKHAPPQSTCQRCLRQKNVCSDERPPTPRRKLNTVKCSPCRRRKQRCEFRDGQWPAKCHECDEHNLECSEPKETERREAKKRSKNIRPRALTTPSSSHTARLPAHDIPGSHLQSPDLSQAGYDQSFPTAAEDDKEFWVWIQQEILTAGHGEAMCGGNEDLADVSRTSADQNLETYINFDPSEPTQSDARI